MHRASTSPLLVLLLAGPLGCAAQPGLAAVQAPLARGDVAGALARYDRLVKRRVPDRLGALQQIAGTVVVREASAEDRAVRDQAFVVLASLGEGGLPLLRRLVREPDPVGARARAALLRAGEDVGAERLARAVRSPFPEARGAALAWLREEERWDDLKAALVDVDAAVRRAALENLAGMSVPEAEPLADTISDVLRHDPAPAVRAAAARLLGLLVPRAVDALEQAMVEDGAVSVRVAAVAALGTWVRPARTGDEEPADPMAELASVRARALLRRAASGEPTPAGVEAARLLGEQDDDALAYLRRALASGPASLRGQALVAAASSRRLRADVRALFSDPSDEIRLRAAAGLARVSPGDRAAARRTLHALLDRPAATALQAAIALAELRDRRGLPAAVALLESSVAGLRATAAFAVGDRFGRRDRVRALLLDGVPSVRLSAARAILSGGV
jgi:HEAT repeat protein